MPASLYLECSSGISGDMTVAALLDLGADEQVLKNVLDSIPVKGFSVEISRVMKSGIDCCDFKVVLDPSLENHDHDMEYLHGHGHYHEQSHHHEHRGLPEIMEIMNQTDMSAKSRELALRIFQILAEAEAKAHARPAVQVHFHEVGAVDSIVDIIAAAVCIDNLGIKEVIVPELCEGKGTVRTRHGVLPIPVPAVANIIASHGLPVSFTDCQGEFVTPTGAAIAAAIMTSDTLPRRFTVKKTGMGAGKRTYERPSILRAMLIESKGASEDVIYKLESNIDDCSGEALGYVMDRLFDAGARDVCYTPVYMKKNRPGWQINVICDEADISVMEDIIFQNTTTIGIRRCRFDRTVLEREQRTVTTPCGEAKVKVCRYGERVYYYPEYDSVSALCINCGLPFQEACRMVAECAEKA